MVWLLDELGSWNGIHVTSLQLMADAIAAGPWHDADSDGYYEREPGSEYTDYDDFELRPDSPAIDAGTDAPYVGLVYDWQDHPVTDANGKSLDGHIDIGVYEFNPAYAGQTVSDAGGVASVLTSLQLLSD
jgi:hypothetical protein